jgi:hypothetical protein
MILPTRITLTLVYCLIRPVISWDQGLADEEEYEILKPNIVYLSTYNCDLSPTVCPPNNVHSYHPTSCPYINRRSAQIEEIKGNEISDVLCLQVHKPFNIWLWKCIFLPFHDITILSFIFLQKTSLRNNDRVFVYLWVRLLKSRGVSWGFYIPNNRPYSHRSHVESRTRLRGYRLFTLYRIACSLSQKNITNKQIKTCIDFFITAMSTGDKWSQNLI